MCADTVTLPVAGVAETVPAQESPIKPAWQRWNDYGIGCLLEGGALNPKRGNLPQAEAAFAKLLTLGAKDAVSHGHLNLARVYIDEGRLDRGGTRTERGPDVRPARAVVGAGVVHGARDRPERDDAAPTSTPPSRTSRRSSTPPTSRGTTTASSKFDFTKDYVVLDELGRTLYKRSTLELADSPAERDFLLRAGQRLRTRAGDRPRRPRRPLRAQPVLRPPRRTPRPEPATPDRTGDGRAARSNSPIGWRRRAHRSRTDSRTARPLIAAITAFGKLAPDPKAPRLPTIRALIDKLRPAYHDEQDPAAQTAIAAALANLHLVSHTLYKPDELARARDDRALPREEPGGERRGRGHRTVSNEPPGGAGPRAVSHA